MKRKLIKQGAGGLTVCLPKKWTEKYHLRGGEEIEIVEKDGNLIFSTEAKKELKIVKLELDEISHTALYRIITNNYKKGVDELHITFTKNNLTPQVDTILKDVIGFEMIETSKNTITLKSFSAGTEEEIHSTIKKSFFQLKEALNIIQEDMDENNYINFPTIKQIQTDVKKLTNYAIRTTIKVVDDKNKIHSNCIVFRSLNIFGNKLMYVYEHLQKEKKIYPHTKKLVQELAEYLDMYYQIYYTKKINLLEPIQKLKERMVQETDAAIDSKNGKVLLQIMMAMRLLFDSLGLLVADVE